MLEPMKRFFIVISSLVCIFAVLAGAGYWYLQQALKNLPLEQLDYQLEGFAYKHIHFKSLAFIYHDPALDPQLRAAVQADDVFVTWEWHGFKPNLQIIEIGTLEASLSEWPSFTNEPPDSSIHQTTWLDQRLPRDRRVPDTLPHLLAVDNFSIALPCQQQRCYYSGHLHATSKNKERLLLPNEPQITTIRLAVSPHDSFQEMQQIDLRLRYEVMNQLPSLALDLQSPGHFQLSLSQHLDNANRLRTELDSSLEPSMIWLVEQLALWRPALSDTLQPYLGLWNDTVQLELDMQNELPDAPFKQWPMQLTGAAQAQAALANQAVSGVQMQLERNPDIQFNGDMHLTLLPPIYRNLNQFLAQTLSTEQVEPLTQYSEQLTDPLRAEGSWRINLPPGAAPQDWPTMIDGQTTFTLANTNWLELADVARIQPQLAAELHFSHGQLAYIDAIAKGDLQLSEDNPLPVDQVNPDNMRWSVQTELSEPMSFAQIPLHFELQSHGSTDISINSDLQLTMEPNQPLQLQSEHGLLTLRQAQWQGPIQLEQIELKLPFSLQIIENEQIQLQGSERGQAHMTARGPAENSPGVSAKLDIALQQWRWLSPWQMPQQSKLTADVVTRLSDVNMAGLKPLNWQWQSSLELEPLHALGLQAQATGRISNSAGLSLRHQARFSNNAMQLDWQLSDIFWLAGNPLRDTFDYWPELLTFERGRTNASGTLYFPLATLSETSSNTGEAVALQLQLGLFDTAGIYDTLDFSGANLNLALASDLKDIELEVSEATVQRLQYGMPMGPAELAFSYQGNLEQWLAGELNGVIDLHHNQLSLLRGVVALDNQTYDLAAPELRMQINLSQLDLQQLLSEYPGAEIQGQGLLSGAIPVRWKAGEGFSVEDGRIHALPPGGQIQYRAERARQLSETNQAVRILMDALNDFHYSVLEGGVSYRDDGTLELALTIEGLNPELEGGRPVRLDIRIAEDLPALLASLQLTNQLNDIIQERVQQRLIEALR